MPDDDLRKTVETLKADVAFLADRLAIAMTLQHEDLYRAITVLPKRENDRELLRDSGELGGRYGRELNIVRQVVALDRQQRAKG